MNWFRNIGLLILLLLAGRMAAQVPVLDSVCSGAVRNYRVDGEAKSTYSWILTPPAGPAVTLPSNADSLKMLWNYPAGIYELKAIQHPEYGCDADAVLGLVFIFGQPEVYAGPDAQVCVGNNYKLVNATAANTRSLLWKTSGDGTFDDITILLATYTPGANDLLAGTVTLKLSGTGMVEDGGCDPSVSTMVLDIVTEIIPQFDPIGPLCQYSTPPALPDTSLEGITGDWNPATISTDITGTFYFTFTPDDPGQCGVDTTISIAVVTEITPQFDPIGPLCQNNTPPALPDTSLNGITGTWEPDTISTGNTGTFYFKFKPDDTGQCGVDTTIEITVLPQVIPEFDTIGPILCQYSAAPVLPDTSLNGVTGTWDPPWISTAVPGFFTYTFYPDPGQCGVVVTIDITIIPEITPQFDPIGLLCQYSDPPGLPETSNNGITGTWNPPTINTDVTGTFFYTFTPDTTYQCVLPVTIAVTIVWDITPVFDPIGPLCQYSTPPALPDTSLQGITGNWNPATISTGVPGIFNFTFTPDPDQCSVDTTIYIAIVKEIIPQFDPIGPLCQYHIAPALPDTSLEGITGNWNPATISTDFTGTFPYTFSPDDPGQCGVDTIIYIAIVTEITPQFDPIGPLCQNNTPPALPDTSLNGITGVWEPDTIITNVPDTVTYTFTPDDPGQCGVVTTMDIAVVTEITPAFNPIGPLCLNSPPPPLPASSNNIPAITGTWDPLVIDTSVPGTATYTFTPDEGQCAVTVILGIEVTEGIIPVFDQIGPLCQYSTPLPLPVSSDNTPAITGKWVPPIINTFIPGTLTYTFTPDTGQCAVAATMEIEVTEKIVPLFDQIGPLSQNTIAPPLPASSNDTPAITGTWEPPFIDTSVPGTFTYIFTPDAGQCATITHMDITVLFDYLEAIIGPGGHCLGDAAIVPLVVDHFISVASFQLKLSFNVDNLFCEGLLNPHPQLADSLKGWVDNINGVITLQWHDTPPVTFPGLETVCELVFIPKQPGLGQLDWYTGATESYFKDLAGSDIPAEFSIGEFIIYQPPDILLANTKTVCEGDTVTIAGVASGMYPPLIYQWTYPDGQTQTTDLYFAGVTQADAGDYTLLVTDSLGCTDLKSIHLVVSENPVAAFYLTDTLTVPPGYRLEAGTGLASYLWNTGETTESIEIETTGWYWVEMESHVGCTGTDSVYIIVSDELTSHCLFIPNAFTPDNDGMNDTFKAVSICPLTNFRMLIFDRWGGKMFETDDISIGWDGKKNGATCPGDVYVYKIIYKAEGAPEGENEQVEAGTVVIVK